MAAEIGFRTLMGSEKEWSTDDDGLRGQPGGAQIKPFVLDADRKIRADLLRLMPGYREEPHAHAGTHVDIVLEGSITVGETPLGPDDVYFGASGFQHEALTSPKGAVLFSVYLGDPLNRYEYLSADAAPVAASGLEGPKAMRTIDIPWFEGTHLTKLPEGPEHKYLITDTERDMRVIFIWHPTDYIEPRHIHEATHTNVVLSGSMIVDGRELKRGDVIYGPSNVDHGPLDSPDGVVLIGVVRGGRGGFEHKYEK